MRLSRKRDASVNPIVIKWSNFDFLFFCPFVHFVVVIRRMICLSIDGLTLPRYFLMFAVNICLGQGPSVARWPIGQYPQRSMEISNPVVGGIKRPILSAHHWMTRSISHRPIARNSRRLETLDYFSPIKTPTSPVLEHWQVLVECLELYSLKFVLDGTTLGFVGFQLVYLNFFPLAPIFFHPALGGWFDWPLTELMISAHLSQTSGDVVFFLKKMLSNCISTRFHPSRLKWRT